VTTMCLDCRTAFIDGDRCDGSEHRTIHLASARGALVEAVWGGVQEQIQAYRDVQAAHAQGLRFTAGGAALGGLAGVVAGLGPLALVGAVAGGAAVVSSLLVRKLRRSPPERPRGAAPLPNLSRFARGRIRGATGVTSPASGAEGAAWALELRYDAAFGSRVMLRAGETAGMEIALENGERVRIPDGSIRLAEPLPQLADYQLGSLETWLRELDPARALACELCPPFPFNVVGEALLQIGDRVELFQSFEPIVQAGAGAALYREAPATILMPRSVATLRRLR
jgi:hypothetical protein